LAARQRKSTVSGVEFARVIRELPRNRALAQAAMMDASSTAGGEEAPLQ
jgi:hypothetical protein